MLVSGRVHGFYGLRCTGIKFDDSLKLRKKAWKNNCWFQETALKDPGDLKCSPQKQLPGAWDEEMQSCTRLLL